MGHVMNKPKAQPVREPSMLDCEAAIYEIAGAASIASFVFDAIAEDPNAASSQALRLGMSWLDQRLAASAENLVALLEMRAPRWVTTANESEIAEALALAERAGKDRRVRSCGSVGE